MGYDDRVTIERATNGYTVSMRDPKVVAKNRARDLSTKSYTPYEDPERTYVFTDITALNKFLTDNLDKALPKNSYSSSFDAIASSMDDD